MKHPVVHFEIGGHDVARSSTFYESLFGWKSNAGALDLGTAEGIRGHLVALGHEPHSYVTVYVEVEDVEAALVKAEKLGGTRVVGPTEIPTGWFAWFRDLDGNTMGLLKRHPVRPLFIVQHSAESLLTDLGLLDQSRAIRVTSARAPTVGTAIDISLEVGDRAPLMLCGEVKEPFDTGFIARVDLGPEQRTQLDDALAWATGSQRPVRAEPRFPTLFPVTLQGDDPKLVKYVKNLSRKGAFIRTKKSPPIGSAITVVLRLPDGGEPIEAEARVVRAADDGVGVRFETVSASLKQRLDAFIAGIEQRAGKLAIVADDDALIRAMVGGLLEGQGVRVLPAASGPELLALATEYADRLTLIVMDLVMPGRDGFEVVSELAAMMKARSVPVVVITGGGPEAAQKALACGARHAILKGATSDDILLAIETAMRGH